MLRPNRPACFTLKRVPPPKSKLHAPKVNDSVTIKGVNRELVVVGVDEREKITKVNTLTTPQAASAHLWFAHPVFGGEGHGHACALTVPLALLAHFGHGGIR